MDKYLLCIGIDIGTKNFAITVCEKNGVYKHIHIDISDSKLNIFETICKIVTHFNMYKYNIKIEQQLKTNYKCIKIQTILETILVLFQIKYQLIDAKIKYKQLRRVYDCKFNKKKLQSYIAINKDNCKYYKFISELVESSPILKMDDIIDSLLICNS